MKIKGAYKFQPRYTRNGQKCISEVWWIQYRMGSRRVRESAGTRDKTEARRFLKRREGAVALRLLESEGKVICSAP